MDNMLDKVIRITIGVIVYFIVFKTLADQTTLVRILAFAGIYFPLVLIFNRFSKK